MHRVKKQSLPTGDRMIEKAIPAVEKMLKRAINKNKPKSIDYYSGILEALKEISKGKIRDHS